MNRRALLKTGGGAIAALGLSTVLSGCNPKNLSGYVQTVVSALAELKALLPNSATFIDKATKLATDFDAAYRAGNFVNAATLFATLSDTLTQITTDAGVNTPTVKIALAVAGVGMRAIAVLLNSQAQQPAVASSKAMRGAMSTEAVMKVSLIQRLADSAAVDRVYEASKP